MIQDRPDNTREKPDVIIRADALTKRFDGFTAVDRITFTVRAGEVVGYLGPNGSGKTTTFRMLLGLLQPSDGKASVLGYDCLRESEQIRRRVGYMSQKFALYHDLTVGENLAFYAGVYGISSRKRVSEVLDLVGLSDMAAVMVSKLSTGWRQRLALGTAIVHHPQLLFLDEPTSGVDPTTRRSFWDLIYALVEGGVTAFVTTHYMDEAEYCGRVGIMRAGQLLAMDTPTGLKDSHLLGAVWEIFAEPLLQVLTFLNAHADIQRARLAGDHLSVIVNPGVKAGKLKKIIEKGGAQHIELKRVQPTLEDVFLALAKEQ
ncbi:MAG: ABC transporter ATP-binding protein [Anaerolineaceae bacterium]|nr:ABC transporter ATP-binding protein [Anaerolineaceae bacterium]